MFPTHTNTHTATLRRLFVQHGFGTRLGHTPPTPKANTRKWVRVQNKQDPHLTSLDEARLSDKARLQLISLKEALDNKTSTSNLDLGELTNILTPTTSIVTPNDKTFVPSLVFPDVNPKPVVIDLPTTKANRGWWPEEVHGTGVFPGTNVTGAPSDTCLGNRRSRNGGEMMPLLRLLRSPDIKADDISKRTVPLLVNRRAQELASQKELFMALKTIGDFDLEGPAHDQDHGWKDPVTPTTMVLADVKEGVLSASNCRHAHTCTCTQKHYMWPHEGEVTGLEGRQLRYSLRACLLVNSMQDPTHRKRKRQEGGKKAMESNLSQDGGDQEEGEASSRESGEEEENEEEDPDQGTGVDEPLRDVFEDQSGRYNTESLREAGTSGWPLRAGVIVLVPMYTNAKTAGGKMTAVVYCLMQVTKLVHATYVVTSLPGGSWAIRFSMDNSACFLCCKFWLLDDDHVFTVRR